MPVPGRIPRLTAAQWAIMIRMKTPKSNTVAPGWLLSNGADRRNGEPSQVTNMRTASLRQSK
jgi:hypothetical protein